MTYKVTISDNGVTVNQIIESVNLETACEAMRAQMIDAESITDGNEGVEMRDKWTEAIMDDSASCILRGESQDGQAWARVKIEAAPHAVVVSDPNGWQDNCPSYRDVFFAGHANYYRYLGACGAVVFTDKGEAAALCAELSTSGDWIAPEEVNPNGDESRPSYAVVEVA